MDLRIIFLTGLTVGGLTCLAVQGGLLASVIAAREDRKEGQGRLSLNAVMMTLAFLGAKLAVYLTLGFLLGLFGGAFRINQTVQIIMQFSAGLYMVVIALNLLNIHPVFRYAVIQPPKFITKLIRYQSKSREIFAPLFLGAMTVFIPCGTTLAMEALAINSASPFMGAAIMTAFIAGTIPLFLGVGWITGVLGNNFKGKFLKIAAFAVLYLGLISINGSLIAGGFPINSQTIVESLRINRVQEDVKISGDKSANQTVEITVSAHGYSPDYFTVKKGSPVTLKLIAKEDYSCAFAFRISSLGIKKNLQANEIYTVTFTPENAGKIRFACSMGMYTGTIEVI